ncbi:MAG: aminodeoxychorismate/anthranilate synthase component II [Armatimonadetes bacterium]|nr:aminodeoxychorismate/anthranilate synthase component II [Armatimonadota bacterium]
MVLVVDNYDSFTYNLVQYLGELGVSVAVRRNDEFSLAEVEALRPQGIMLSPGPCTPEESGICLDILKRALSDEPGAMGCPIFGVCLGHEAIGTTTGGSVRPARTMMHGKASPIEHDGKGVFTGVPSPFNAIRYHSLVVDEARLSPDLEISARSLDDGEIMGLRHKTKPIEGIQFHPESIATEHGMTIVSNFVAMTKAFTR